MALMAVPQYQSIKCFLSQKIKPWDFLGRKITFHVYKLTMYAVLIILQTLLCFTNINWLIFTTSERKLQFTSPLPVSGNRSQQGLRIVPQVPGLLHNKIPPQKRVWDNSPMLSLWGMINSMHGECLSLWLACTEQGPSKLATPAMWLLILVSEAEYLIKDHMPFLGIRKNGNIFIDK